LILDKLHSLYGISYTDLLVLLIINNANRIGKKITRVHIVPIMNLTPDYLGTTVLQGLKKKGLITLNYNYKLTDKGKGVLNVYGRLVTEYANKIHKESPLSFAEYMTKNTNKNSYKYKIKTGIIKEPGKKYDELV
jgi:predicted transcriptional regulator